MGKLDNKVAIITGASGGIGRAAAVLFAKEGASISIASRNVEAGEETVRIIKENGRQAIFIRTDVSKVKDVKNMVKTTVDYYSKLDILYNNAAIVHEPAQTIDITFKDWQYTLAINLTGTWLGMKFAIPEMIRAGGGAIINTASICALVGVPNQSAYSATKGGIVSISRTTAVEYASRNIRVNCIAPGPVATPMALKFFGEEHTRNLADLNPRSQIGRMEEIAEVALFLASEESSHVIGQVLTVDGGHTIDSHIR